MDWASVQTGDVLLVHGDSFVQKGIEVATSSPFCHVALLIKGPAQPLVAEFVEGVGFQSMALSDWLAGRPDDVVFFGKAPERVYGGADLITRSLEEYSDPEKREYGYGELFEVWMSQFTKKDYHTPHEVCSLFVQHRWEIAGFKTPGCAAPGDFLFWCQFVAKA